MKSLKAISIFSFICLTVLMACSSSGSMQDINTGPMTLRNYLEQESGVTITGEGASTTVTIRGTRDISGPKVSMSSGKGAMTMVQTQNSPLFIIDGIPLGRNFYRVASMLTPSEIADVKVLSPTQSARFGSRGINGAVIITTKAGVKTN